METKKIPFGLTFRQARLVVMAVATLALVACGGGSSTSTLAADVKAQVATGTVTGVQAAMDLLIGANGDTRSDTVSATEFEAAMLEMNV